MLMAIFVFCTTEKIDEPFRGWWLGHTLWKRTLGPGIASRSRRRWRNGLKNVKMANDVADDERVDGSGDGAGCSHEGTEGIGRHYFSTDWANWRLFIGYGKLGVGHEILPRVLVRLTQFRNIPYTRHTR